MTAPELSLLDGAFYAGDPYPAFAWLRKNAPVYRDPVSGVWCVTRYHDVKAVGTAPSVFSNAGGIRPDQSAMPYLIDMDDPEHRRRRRLVGEGFLPKAVAARQDAIGEICDDLIDRVRERGECDFVEDLAAPLPLYVIGSMLGVDRSDRADLLRWSDDMVKALGSPDPDALQGAMTAFAEYSGYIRERIAARRRDHDESDLLGILAHAEFDGDHLDEDSLIFESLLLLIAGDETTRHVISGGMEALFAHPEQLARLRADRSLLPSALEEMLRWVSPVKNMCRTAVTDTKIGDTEIAAGDKVILLYPSANRDEEVFDRADEFDITRQPNDHVAFGFGPHFCLGSKLARLELTEIFTRLLDRLPDLELAGRIPLPRRAANFVSGIETMPVTCAPAQSDPR